MTLNPSIFRMYDIRGVVDIDLTPDTVTAIGYGFGKFLQSRIQGKPISVAIAGDARESTPIFIQYLTDALNSLGIAVINGGLIPTPVLYFSVFDRKVEGAIMVTASHNPPEFNGFKMLIGTDALSGEEIQEVYELAKDWRKRLPETGNATTSTEVDMLTPFVNYFRKQFPKGSASGIKVVVDAGNGIAGPVGPNVFREMGCEVIELFCEVDGSFPNHHPDPTVEANMVDIREKVLKEKADLGIAFDGDGDRIGVVDDKGRIIWGDQLLTLFALDILKEKGSATFIGEVKCSQIMYDLIEKAGGNAIMWTTGHSIIKKKMKEVHALLAGEMSGHIFFADRYFGFDDAIYAGCRMLEMLKKDGRKLSDIFDTLPKMATTPEMKVDCADEKKFQVIADMQEAVSSGSADLPGLKKVITIDGLRMIFEDGWSLVRASNTQPVLVLRMEASGEAELSRIRTETENFLQRYLNN
ncbi:MAG: phosphomannomutase/phosphoglucomutase [Acidobacteria bacterium]|nr:phosphomannomutase/phosphoglucomutase [Acidobacteriota bacterium]